MMTKLIPVSSSIELLQRSPGLRSLAYLASMATTIEVAHRLTNDPQQAYNAMQHPVALPVVIGVTYVFARLRPDDQTAWEQLPTREDIRAWGQGFLLGSGAMLSVLGIAAACGWASAPAWGWQQAEISLGAVLISMAQRSLIHTTIVCNEEIVFRGYGLDTLRAAVGLPGAVAISTALFAVYHGLGQRQLLGTGVAGLLLTVLRLGSGKLWLGAGCHFGWNSIQTVVFGPADGPPSLRPLQLHGPEAWVGRPGTAEPGWLSILIPAALALGALGYFWRKGRIPPRN